jgi:predicted Zn-dependent protease with MMP-like domain
MAYHVTREEFEQLAEDALSSIPKKYLRRFANLTIIVESRPDDDVIEMMDLPGNELLGLFTGAGYPSHGGFFDNPRLMPDSIILYQDNIEAICQSRDDLAEEIRFTMVHEIGHYFGMSDDELLQYE